MLLTLLAVASVQAAAPQPSPTHQALSEGGKIASQPARDIGAARTAIPPVLERAAAAPYGLAGTRDCAQLSSGIAGLTAALGPDFRTASAGHRNRVGQMVELGGESLVNGLIPFRGLVREVSGAAPAQRRLDAAVNAGLARRGFLRGIAAAKRCRI